MSEMLSKLRGLPLYLWLGLLVILPNLLMITYGFFSAKDGRFDYNPTIANYVRISGNYGVWVLLFRTLIVSAISAALAALIAYPMALYTSRLSRGKQALRQRLNSDDF